MKRLSPLLLLLALGVACEVDLAPGGLRQTPPGDGPVVRFDLGHAPWPDAPLPNDVATFPDPTSRTGKRLQLSLAAATSIEQRMRDGLASMEGWGLSAPITVPFERPASVDAREPAIDLVGLLARMRGDEHDPSNDAVYVVNLATGIPVPLDVEGGLAPVVVPEPARYGPADPKAAEPNLVFETTDEAAGRPPFAYAPGLDRDFDGVLDRPNTHDDPARSTGAPRPSIVAGVDDVLTFYERETDTLVLRPVVPLEEKTEYAVVLTDRLRGTNGQPVRSPFAAIHHPAQVAGLTRLRDWLSDGRLAGYYGDIAGSGLDHVAFAWTFTTQPAHEDLRLLRDGLHGGGPFARLAGAYPPRATAVPAAGVVPGAAQPAGWESASDACRARAAAPTTIRPDDPSVRRTLQQILTDGYGLEASAAAAALASLDHVGHIAVGTFTSPSFLGDPADRGARFRLDFRSGKGEAEAREVPWVLVVPRATETRRQPFPVAIWAHGTTDALAFGGDFARQGVAVIGYDLPTGATLGPDRRAAIEGALAASCLVPSAAALAGGGRPGTALWSADPFHARDVLRQAAIDGVQLVRTLRSFDGRAGDFDGDGVADVGGPAGTYFAAGRGEGALAAAILGGIEPAIVATAPIAGGGSLAADVLLRSRDLALPGARELMGPFVFAVPASERAGAAGCPAGSRSLRIEGLVGAALHEIEVACLAPSDLGSGMTVVVTNIASGAERCARVDADGRFQIPVPATAGDPLDVQVYTATDAVDAYGRCRVTAPGTSVGRRVTTYERPNDLFAAGSALVAPSDGLGLRRQSPALRRMRDLAQAALDPGDPVVFASRYGLRPILDVAGERPEARALLAVNTVGDAALPIAAGLAFARAAGAIPFLPPDAVERLPAWAEYATPRELYERLGRRTPMQFLVDRGVVEGVARLGRTSAGPACAANQRPASDVCAAPGGDPGCATALFDPDWVSEGGLPFDAPHPDAPLRLARASAVRVADSTSLAAAWEPRLRGVPLGPDEAAWTATARVVGVLDHYVAPGGAHGWASPDACRAWDPAAYGNALLARFFASGGRDVYYLSHPRTHGCLADASCDFLR